MNTAVLPANLQLQTCRAPLLAIQGEAFGTSNARRLACRKLNLSGGAKQQQPHEARRQATARNRKWRFHLCVSVPAFGLISFESLLATTTSSCRIVPPLRSHSGMVWLDSSDDTWGTKMVHSTSGVGHMPRSFESTILSLTVTISDSPASSNNARFLHHKRWRKCTSNIKYSVFGLSILKHILNEYVRLCSYS